VAWRRFLFFAKLSLQEPDLPGKAVLIELRLVINADKQMQTRKEKSKKEKSGSVI